jgi:hypothetical protein
MFALDQDLAVANAGSLVNSLEIAIKNAFPAPEDIHDGKLEVTLT